MASLVQLLAAHESILVLDAASAVTQAGLLRPRHPAIWRQSGEEAGRALFILTNDVLVAAGCELRDVRAFVYCQGPGSMLGTRTVAMALRTWLSLLGRPVFAYQSLAVAAVAEWQRAPRAFTVIADARRETWHGQGITAAGRLGALQRLATADLTGELVTPQNFRAWSASPAGVRPCAYDLGAIFAVLGNGDYFAATAEPDAFQHEAPEYKKWTAQVHSAESAPPR